MKKNPWDDVSEAVDTFSTFLLELFQDETEPLLKEFDIFLTCGSAVYSREEYSDKRSEYLGSLFCECKWLYKNLRTVILENHQLHKETVELRREIYQLKSQSYN